MPLPNNPKLVFPPKDQEGLQHDYQEAAAWYSGDTTNLAEFYGSTDQETKSKRVRFWARRHTEDNKRLSVNQRVHLPVAGDIAATSADLLYGESPTILLPADQAEGQGRLDVMLDSLGFQALLIEAAEIASGIGGVFLRVGYDSEILNDSPLVDTIHADKAIPEFSYGWLRAVTFFTVVKKERGMVYRHLERHEYQGGRAVIEHGLYLAEDNAKVLGRRIPLNSIEETSGYTSDLIIMPEDIKGLAVAYVPNILPNRKRRGLRIGRADTAGLYSMLDSLDETYNSLLRDIRLAKARLIVPDEYLDRQGRGQGGQFDLDREIFTPLEIDPSGREGVGITASQFEIRSQQHLDTAANLLRAIYQAAGYSPQTFGLDIDGQAESGTALRIREKKSYRTTEKKARYFMPAVAQTVYNLQVLDKAYFNSQLIPAVPSIIPSEADQPSITERATAVNLLKQAQAASIETRVAIAQPDLSEEEKAAEVQRILEQEGLIVDMPYDGLE